MERYGATAAVIIDELHTKKLDYQNEYLPLIDCANQCKAYEDTGLTPREVAQLQAEYEEACKEICNRCTPMIIDEMPFYDCCRCRWHRVEEER